MMHQLGDRLGRYEITGILGHGAMGMVYLAHDPQIERPVALKTLSPEAASGERAEEIEARFVKEAKMAGRLQHPNIVTIYDVGRDKNVVFIAMEFVDGEPLTDWIPRKSFLLPHRIEVVRQAVRALEHAHERGVVHRDVKPGNILLTSNRVVKVADFGIGKLLAAGTPDLTRTGMLVGSPAYMSPEQIKGERIDGRSDFFSLGVVFYQLMTGTRPFPGEAITTLVYQILHTEPRDPRELNAELPEGSREIFARLLAKSPDARPRNAEEFIREIEKFENDRTIRMADLRSLVGEPPKPEPAATERITATPPPPPLVRTLEPVSARHARADELPTSPLRTRQLPEPPPLRARPEEPSAGPEPAVSMPQPSAPSGKRSGRPLLFAGGAAAAIAVVIAIVWIATGNRGEGGSGEVKKPAPTTIAAPVLEPTSPARVVSPEHLAMAATARPTPQPTAVRREAAPARPPTVAPTRVAESRPSPPPARTPRPSPVVVAVAVAAPTAVAVPTPEPRVAPPPSPTHVSEVVAEVFPTRRPASEGALASSEERLTKMAEEGRVLFKTGRYKECVELMGQLQTECLKGENHWVCLGLKAGAALYRGASYAELGNEVEARAQFWTFQALKPNTYLSPREYSYKVIHAFDLARRMR